MLISILMKKPETIAAISFWGIACVVSIDTMAQVRTPNIIFILADDLGYGDLACLNALGKIKTPCIDQLARDGVLFMDAHSSSAVSTPTRYGVLTGRYNWRSTLKQGVLHSYGQPLIQADRMTMPKMLKSRGYLTACIGKWHLGMNFPTIHNQKAIDTVNEYNLDFSQNITGGPCDVGFDYFFGVDAPNYPPYCFIENDKMIGLLNQFYPGDNEMDTRAGHGTQNWNMKDILPTLEQKSVCFIEESVQNAQPFFLYLPLTSPHSPVVPTDEFQNQSNLNRYADFVMQTDAVVGRIMEALKQNGIADNTIVVFTSDNGCSPHANFEQLKEKGHNPSYIFRGAKSDLFEGGHHVPCIVSWPAEITPHQVDQTICLVDFMATFAAIVNYRLADNEAEDSYDIGPLLTVPDYGKTIREAVVHHSIDGSFAIRQGQWKLLLSSYSGGWSEPKAIGKGHFGYQLYDLKRDPNEKNNLCNSYPQLVTELRILLERYIKMGRSTPGSIQRNDGDYPWSQLFWMD